MGQETRRALTRTGGFLKGFAFSINPYIGCAFGASRGCPFCYVRALPVASVHSGRWGNWVIAKTNLPELLEKELRQLAHKGRLADTTIFMSSATDPYQGYERTMKLSRSALELFARFPPRRLLVQTRSPMIERDIDLLQQLGRTVIASITIETDDDSVRRAITPTSASVARRILTAQRLRAVGIYTQIAIAPMLPNRPDRFAAMVDGSADRVIVDTYFDGDGSKGRRTRALGIEELYSRLGYQGWFRPGAQAKLVAALSKRLGAERVLFSQQGFSAL
ncbi:MAG TPA: radical SAM protein [Candidatus Binataceae bacterium]|nr:radical SAM protein [Candidatus Binataceae bacterium]